MSLILSGDGPMERIAVLRPEFPELFEKVGNYEPVTVFKISPRVSLAIVSGHGPWRDGKAITGKVGVDLSIGRGYEAVRYQPSACIVVASPSWNC